MDVLDDSRRQFQFLAAPRCEEASRHGRRSDAGEKVPLEAEEARDGDQGAGGHLRHCKRDRPAREATGRRRKHARWDAMRRGAEEDGAGSRRGRGCGAGGRWTARCAAEGTGMRCSADD